MNPCISGIILIVSKDFLFFENVFFLLLGGNFIQLLKDK